MSIFKKNDNKDLAPGDSEHQSSTDMRIGLGKSKEEEPSPEEEDVLPVEEAEPSPVRKRRFLPSFRTVLYWFTVVFIWLTVTFVGAVSYYALTLPDPGIAGLSKRPPNVTILASNGKIIANRGMRRNHIRLEHMPKHLVNAVLAIEDNRFYNHFGVDPIGIIRASWENYRRGDYVQGGSTITQQLAKNLFFSSQKTVARKMKEGLTALWLEMHLSKKEILELYLNRSYFGAGAYGIEAAAYRYFGKSARKLTLAESALLAGLLKAPSRYNPARNPKTSRRRARIVLQRMMKLGLENKKKARNAIFNPAKLRSQSTDNDFNYVADWVIERLPGYLGTSDSDQDLVVHTTIDHRLQKLTQSGVRRIINKEGRRKRVREAAAIIYDRRGAIKALSGGLSHKRSPFNRAVKAMRQPGSAFKPFVFLAALEQGKSPRATVKDSPVNVNGWTPRNYAGFYRGPISMRTALAKSVNTAAVRLFLYAGRENVVKTARRLGISTDIHHKPSLALGTAEVTLMELTGAYVPFANGGMGILPHVISQIKNAKGKVLYQRKVQGSGRVIDYGNVKAMNRMMSSVVTDGTGKRAWFPGQAMAGKTGTSQDYKDAWFLGFTPYYTMGVWVGNDNNRKMRRVTGGDLPALIWRHVMERAHRGKRSKGLPGVRRYY